MPLFSNHLAMTPPANCFEDHPPSKPAQNDKNNDEGDRRYEALVSASANIALTMLHRGKFLEDELKRALDHVRTSNEFLEKFVELLESVDEERKYGQEDAGSWKEVAERVKNVVKGGGRRVDEKEVGQDAENEESVVGKDEKTESDAAPSVEKD
jgi:hypothetical protein